MYCVVLYCIALYFNVCIYACMYVCIYPDPHIKRWYLHGAKACLRELHGLVLDLPRDSLGERHHHQHQVGTGRCSGISSVSQMGCFNKHKKGILSHDIWDIWSINDPYDLDVHQQNWALIWPCPQLRSALDMTIMISFNLRRAPEMPQVHPINLLMYSYKYLSIYIYIHIQCNTMQYIKLHCILCITYLHTYIQTYRHAYIHTLIYIYICYI